MYFTAVHITAVYRTAVCMTTVYIIALQCLHCTRKNATDFNIQDRSYISVVSVFLTAVHLTEVFGAAVHFTGV